MTEILILTGYLGAGKTTTLTNILKTVPPQKKIAVVINEFAAIGIDGKIVSQDGMEVKELSNGCVCCSKGRELKDTLRLLKDKHSPELIILETTGVASIEPILRIADETGIPVRGVVTLIDAHRLLNSNGFGKVSQKQLKLSSVAIINKADLVTPEKAVCFVNRTKFINPKLNVIVASFGRVSFKQISNIPRFTFTIAQHNLAVRALKAFFPGLGMDDASRHLSRSGIKSVSFETATAIDRNRFDVFIAHLPKSTQRAKAILHFAGEAQPQLFQYASGLISLEPHLEKTKKSSIVIIGKFSQIRRFTLLQQLRKLKQKSSFLPSISEAASNAKYFLKSM